MTDGGLGITLALLGINLVTFVVYGVDKRRAKRHQGRIPERTLLLLALIGGSIGAYLGMHISRHKTKHRKFTLGVPLILILQIGLTLYLLR